MKTRFVASLAILTLILISAHQVFADQQSPATSEKAEVKGEVINEICPVEGGKVEKNTAYKVEYKDKTIGFCCSACPEQFKADPEKYIKNIDEKSVIK